MNRIIIVLLLSLMLLGCNPSKYGRIEEKRIIKDKHIVKIEFIKDFDTRTAYCWITESKYNLYQVDDTINPDYVHCHRSIDDLLNNY